MRFEVIDFPGNGGDTMALARRGSSMDVAFSPAVRSVIFDIDGTLANVNHRLHHVIKHPPNWPAFFAAMDRDPPNLNIVEVLNAMRKSGYPILLCSGRPEKYRRVTEEWLLEYKIEYKSLFMRPDGDYRADHIVKQEMLGEIKAGGYDPFLVVDDRVSVIRMWRENGLEVLQARGHDEPQSYPETAKLVLLVGPSGAGKTSWLDNIYETRPMAHELGVKPWHVVSSDQIREDLCGSFRDQSKNDQVFWAVHRIVRERLELGLPTVVDATNIRNKDRKAVVELVSSAVPVSYVVIDRPLEEKRATGGWRLTLDIDLIGKHHETFQSNLKDILRGDGFPNVKVFDGRRGPDPEGQFFNETQSFTIPFKRGISSTPQERFPSDN